MPTQHSSFALTHTGNVRTRNEDAILDLAQQGLWVVADGMGGHDAGDFASQSIIKHLSQFEKQSSLAQSVDLIEQLLIRANREIQDHTFFSQIKKSKACGSTVVGMLAYENVGITFWAGDSRLYRFRDSLVRLTEDHSLVEELVKQGKVLPQDAESHPDANIILNAIGIKNPLFIDLEYFKLHNNDIYLLCSDGLFKDMNEASISDIITEEQNLMSDLSNHLLDRALDAKGSDNISIICIKTQLPRNIHA